jgi:hypothetical protein
MKSKRRTITELANKIDAVARPLFPDGWSDIFIGGFCRRLAGIAYHVDREDRPLAVANDLAEMHLPDTGIEDAIIAIFQKEC